jgi:hypothetical protein
LEAEMMGKIGNERGINNGEKKDAQQKENINCRYVILRIDLRDL